ncbi:hypothetical protein X975_16373, partial [Stegodyphus mimosarum]
MATDFNHHPYSLDLLPADYFIFAKMKFHLKSHYFSIEQIQKTITKDFKLIPRKIYESFYKSYMNVLTVVKLIRIVY